MPAQNTAARPAHPARARTRYWFDTIVARGTAVLIGWLTLLCLAVVVPTSAVLVWSDDRHPATWTGRLLAVWVSVGQTLKIGGAVGSPVYVLLSVLLALVALLFVSTLVGLITNGLNDKVLDLRRGRSTVLESDHTVLLGWSDQVFPIVSELVLANANRGRAALAVLGPKDKTEMEDEIAATVGRLGRTRLVCRTGATTDPALVALVGPQRARAVLVLTHEGPDGDVHVVKTLLALAAAVRDHAHRPAVVAAVRDGRHRRAAELAAGPLGRVLDIEDVSSRLIARTACEPGLSLVHRELLDFAGDEIYTVPAGPLAGLDFGRLLLAHADSTVIGILRADGAAVLNPPSGTRLEPEDRIVVITHDDDTAVPADGPPPVTEDAIVTPLPGPRAPLRLLLLGWNPRAPRVLDQLDPTVPAGSTLLVVAEGAERLREADRHARLPDRRMPVTVLTGDISDPRGPAGLDVRSFDRVIVLGYEGGPDDLAGGDARTLVTLLHLHEPEGSGDGDGAPAVVTELADDRNRLLAPDREGSEFIVAGRLISLLMTQIAEDRHLAAVFDALFAPGGDTLHLRPAADYVRPDRPVTWATVVESARRRGQCAIGYRDGAGPAGLHVNPDKRAPVLLGPGARVIVLAPEPDPAGRPAPGRRAYGSVPDPR
ncbi:CASTOR/POLLUX-related putative ion channel [Streptomyces sp. BI20]|uniref:CASTOR/POLLUX-related putative ion channel n=1 Tax=Streptomyces sp. BI20 TaxID=3403460 RepID=UPI003C708FBE